MEIMTTTAVYHNNEMELSGGNGSDYEDEHEELEKSLKIMSITINTLVCVLGVLGNGAVIWVTVTGFKMKKTVNTVWYLNLAVADFLLTAFLPLFITQTALDEHWPFGKFMCKLDYIVFYINMYASIFIMMAISVDRCVCVMWPVWLAHRSVRKASCVCLGVWVLALALSSPYFIITDTVPYEDIIWCLPTYEHSQLAAMVFTEFFMGFVVPFTVIVSCYSVIIYRLRSKGLSWRKSDGFIKIIAAVISAFFLCWAPYHIMEQIALWESFLVGEHSETLEYVKIIGYPIGLCLACLNSCLNPLLYVFIGSPDFKGGFRRSVLKVLESEELPQSTNPATIYYSCQTALSETQAESHVRDYGPYPRSTGLSRLFGFFTSLWPTSSSQRDFKVEFRRSVPKVLVPEELPQTNTSTKPGITCQLTALSETQHRGQCQGSNQEHCCAKETLEEQILQTLKELDKEQFKEFKWYLGQRNNLEGLKPLPQDRLEDADKMKTTNLIVQAYPQKKVQIVMNVLKKISREDLALRFQGRPVVGLNRSNVSAIMTTSADVHSGPGQRLDESEIPSTSK